MTAVLEAFLSAIAEQPEDDTQWLILADWLEEQGDPRGELVRLLHGLRQPKACVVSRRTQAYRERRAREDRLRELLECGVKPCQPRCVNSVGMEFVLLPPGTFVMGTLPGEPTRESCEIPHRVTLTRAFWLGVSPVTQRQWETVMSSNPSDPQQDNCPVGEVSFEQCQEFCVELSKKTGQRHRLPTEAEWEPACRAGTTTAFSFGDTISTDRANCGVSSNRLMPRSEKGRQNARSNGTTPAGTFPPNSFGLYDMHGNVWEWCQDWYADYPNREQVDPEVRKKTRNRVMRGGCWSSPPSVCRSGSRNSWEPEQRHSDVGFRIVLCRD